MISYIKYWIIIFFIGNKILIAQEITLYDRSGNATAYIDYSENFTIFLWNGKPVAFLEKSLDDICVFGFNGKFLGWYENGIIYNMQGDAVGAREGSVNMLTKIEPIKSIKQITPIRPITPITPIKPFWNNRWSSTPLIEFLYFGMNSFY